MFVAPQALSSMQGADTAPYGVPAAAQAQRLLLESGCGQAPSPLQPHVAGEKPEEPKSINKRHELNMTLAFSRVKWILGHLAISSAPTGEERGDNNKCSSLLVVYQETF